MADTITQYDNTYDETTTTTDGIQHGIDNDPDGDAEKGATIGGVGGAVVGALAGAAAGPLGAIAGAIIGGVAGGVGSGAAVAAVDRHDNDNTVSGLGDGVTHTSTTYDDSAYVAPTGTTIGNTYVAPVGTTVGATLRNDYDTVVNDLRGDTDTLRGHVDNTRTAANSGIGTGYSQETEVGETLPSLKTGGVANDGTPDTRGIGEKLVDGLTGDDVDDKTGRVVNHP